MTLPTSFKPPSRNLVESKHTLRDTVSDLRASTAVWSRMGCVVDVGMMNASSIQPAGATDDGANGRGLVVFECVALFVLVVSGVALRWRKQQIAAQQQMRYARLAQYSAPVTP